MTSPDQIQTPLPTANSIQEKTDQALHTAEGLLRENKIDEALDVAKTATENPNQNPQNGIGGVV